MRPWSAVLNAQNNHVFYLSQNIGGTHRPISNVKSIRQYNHTFRIHKIISAIWLLYSRTH
jgi:hypothetical protein